MHDDPSAEVLRRFADLERRVAEVETRLGIGGTASVPEGSPIDAAVPQPPAPRQVPPSPVTVALVRKGYYKANIMAGEGNDRLDFELLFKSRLGTNIRAFKGTLVFADLFGTQIMAVALTHEDGLAAAGTARWKGGIEYNQFIAGHARLLSIDPKDLHVSFRTEAVIFADGRTQRFE